MPNTVVADPSVIHNQWVQLYDDLGLTKYLEVAKPTFTAENVIEMYEREVSRIPIFVHPRFGHADILRLGTEQLNISMGTYQALTRLTKNQLDRSFGWCFVESGSATPYQAKLKSYLPDAPAILRSQGAFGMTVEEYVVFMMYSLKKLGQTPEAHGSCLLFGSKSSTGSGVWTYNHDSGEWFVADNLSPRSAMIGLGLRSVILA